MCELLAAIRRVPINPPGGSALPLGDPGNPSYSVAVSDLDATDARGKRSNEVDAARLFPKGTGPSSLLPDALSSALQRPAQSMMATITGRRGSVEEGIRHSSESMRISHDPRRHQNGAYFPAPSGR